MAGSVMELFLQVALWKSASTPSVPIRAKYSCTRLRAGPTQPSVQPYAALGLEPVAGLENPPHPGETCGQKHQGRRQAQAWADVGDAVEAPAEAADQVEHRIGQADALPNRRQDRDRIKAAAQKRQRRDHEQRNDLQLLEPVGPDPDDEP